MGKCVKTNTDFEEGRFLWCSSIAVFFGHAIVLWDVLFVVFFLGFSVLFFFLLDPFLKLREVLQDTHF